MKKFQREYVTMGIKKKINKVIFSFVLTFIVVLTVPSRYHHVYAAPLEDCDLDGYDDATGVPVPWPGYDETKGDTPAGPAGSKSTATPGNTDSTTGSNSESETSDKSSSEDSDKTDDGKSGESKNTNSGKTDSTKSENTNKSTSGKTSTVESGKTNSTAKNSTSNVKSGKASNTNSSKANTKASNDTKKEDTNKTNSAVIDTTKEDSDKTSSTSQKDKNSEAEDTTSSAKPSEENNQEEAPQSDSEQTEGSSDDSGTGNTEASTADIESIINTKGTLEIKEATGSIIHAGGSIIIAGSGFTGDIKDLEIEIQSEPRQLGFVESSEDGSFEVQLNIPEDLEPGVHHIVVLYQGKEITRQQVEVGSKAADSFLQALSVGFTKDNEGLIPGLLILLGLFVLGVGTLGVSAIIRSDKTKANSEIGLKEIPVVIKDLENWH